MATREQQATGAARLERTIAILRHALPIVQKNGVAVSQTGKMFCAPPWRVTLQQRFGTSRIEIYRGRRLAAATWGNGDVGLHVEFLSRGEDWIRDLLRELR